LKCARGRKGLSALITRKGFLACVVDSHMQFKIN
jgi:hypothetical protein